MRCSHQRQVPTRIAARCQVEARAPRFAGIKPELSASPRKGFVAATMGESKPALVRSRKTLTVICSPTFGSLGGVLGHDETLGGVVPPCCCSLRIAHCSDPLRCDDFRYTRRSAAAISDGPCSALSPGPNAGSTVLTVRTPYVCCQRSSRAALRGARPVSQIDCCTDNQLLARRRALGRVRVVSSAQSA